MKHTQMTALMLPTLDTALTRPVLPLDFKFKRVGSQHTFGWHGPYLRLPPEISADVICNGTLLCDLASSSFQLFTKLIDGRSSVCSLLMR